MIDYARMQRTHKIHKGRLTRAQRAGDPVKIIKACAEAVAEWGEIGAWPDDWARWNVALRDTLHWQESLELEDLRGVVNVERSERGVAVFWRGGAVEIVRPRLAS